MKAYGKKTWLIPDTFLSSVSGEGEQPSHEAICVINTGERDAKIDLTLFFESQDAIKGFSSFCGAKRTHHIRMDRIKDAQGRGIPLDTPYAVLIESSEPIVVQYSRLDTSSTRMALMTTIAYPVDEN